MKHLVFLSRESVFGGQIQSNLAELVDCLAFSLTNQYKVSIICENYPVSFANKLIKLKGFGRVSKLRFMKVNYYFIDNKFWEEKSIPLVQKLKPDILHVLTKPEDILKLAIKPEKTVFTFDSIETILGQEEALKYYDAITATSESLLNSIYENEPLIASILSEKKARGVSNGLLTEFFSPEKGLLLQKPYSLSDMSGKKIARESLLKLYSIPKEACIFVTGSLRPCVDMSKIAEIVPYLEEINSYLIVATQADLKSQKIFTSQKAFNRVIHLGGRLGVVGMPSLLAGSDYFIQPEVSDLGNFVPLAANQYGTTPILSLNNYSLQDDFSMRNAIIVEDGNLKDTVCAVAERFHSGIGMMSYTEAGMRQQKAWKDKKNNFIELYE